jgi:hypothetical protein
VSIGHGDIGEHNIVVDTTGDLVLIDWDEGQNIPKARHTYGDDDETRLRHLNELRPYQPLYTEAHMALFFYQIKTKYVNKQDWDHKACDELHLLQGSQCHVRFPKA